MDSNAPRGTDWADIVEVLHTFSTMMTVRAHYADGHPAIQRADELASSQFTRLFERLPEVLVALIDGELVICERPFPDLRERLHILSSAMLRHDIECIVFQRGMTPLECSRLGRALAGPADDEIGAVRERTQAELTHVLLRFADLRDKTRGAAAGTSAFHFVPLVAEMLSTTASTLAEGGALDMGAINSLATEIFQCCVLKTFVLTQRCWSRSASEAATHATNVAMMTGAMALEANLPRSVCVDLTAAALLHDIGQLLLPDEIAGLPETLLDERARALFRNHTFAGASAMLGAGAPPLWIAAALEHHRGVDGGGYPTLESTSAPDELVGLISLASFFDRKRTSLEGKSDTPEDVLRQALTLEGRYFDRSSIERFIRALGVYPPGTTIELSDREPALVLAANANDPWRPRVMLLRGSRGGSRADLAELSATTGQHHLSVVRAIPPPLFVIGDITLPDTPAASSTAPEVASAPTDFLDQLIIVPTREHVLVTSPPPAPSRPPGRYSSRPVVIDEVARLAARKSTAPEAVPIGRRSMPPNAPAPSDKSASTSEIALARVPQRTGNVPPTLDHRGGFLLTFIDGVATVEDIIDASGLPTDDVLTIFRELLASGTIELS